MMSQEWFTYHLVKLNDLFWWSKFEDFEALMTEEELIGSTIMIATGLSATEAIDLVGKKLMVSEEERQAFFSKYGIVSEFANICEQMQAVV